LNTFSQGLREGNLTAPLILKGEDLNLLLASSPDLQFLANGARVSVTGDQIKGQLSLKLGDLGAPFFKDRYLNGEASFKVSLADGRLSVTPDTILVGGKPIPNEYLQEFRKLNLVESANQNSEFIQTLEKLQSIAVTNGEVQVVPKEVP